MKTYELESLLKSFFIFLILFEILLAINFWYEFKVKKTDIEDSVKIELKLCAYTVQCEGLETDFVDKEKSIEVNELYRDGDFYSYFKVPKVENSLMKIVYPEQKFLASVELLKVKTRSKFFLYSIFAMIVSFISSFYSLMPLRSALRLNEEFVKDILHDFNTPISSMRINFKLFKKEIGNNIKIERLENNIETIMSLQKNLQLFLRTIPTESESFDLRSLIEDRLNYFKMLYSDIGYEVSMGKTVVQTNKDALTRVLDNLLSNASKYNMSEGKVSVSLFAQTMYIMDTGKGIKKPSKVFDRYYKEQDRGIGIGMHIVKKICEELNIKIKIESQEGKGTTVKLGISDILV